MGGTLKSLMAYFVGLKEIHAKAIQQGVKSQLGVVFSLGVKSDLGSFVFSHRNKGLQQSFKILLERGIVFKMGLEQSHKIVF